MDLLSSGERAHHTLGTLGLRPLLAGARERLGGPARARAIALFAFVLGLETADLASLGAIAAPLKLALHIDNTQLGLLAAIPSLIAAAATLPFGVLADRVPRVKVLAAGVAVWACGMLLCGASSSYEMLLVVRIFLGATTAAAAPLVASLVGDLFWPDERGRVWGYILAGQLLGTLFGLLISGNIASLSWRAALWVLALPSIAVAVAIWRYLPEPARGGASRLPRTGQRASRNGRSNQRNGKPPRDTSQPRNPAVARAVTQAGVEARPELVLDHDPARMALWSAVRYVLRVRTNDVLIVASSLGYFFQAGVNTFGVVFIVAHFRVSQSAATSLLALVAVGALAGTILGGRLADWLLGRGHLAARIVVGGVGFLVSSFVFVPGILTHSLLVALPLYFVAAAALAAPTAALDAARLDIIPGRLWGRAESIRTVLRTLAVASAPLLFGLLSDQIGSGPATPTKGLGYHASAVGLKYTFLLMLAPMAASGLILLRGRRAYPRDVATALASEAGIARGDASTRASRPAPGLRSGVWVPCSQPAEHGDAEQDRAAADDPHRRIPMRRMKIPSQELNGDAGE